MTFPSTVRQQVLVLYLDTSALDSRVVGWARYDGTGASRPTTGDSDEPPYGTGVAALEDGWRLFQAAQLLPPYPGWSRRRRSSSTSSSSRSSSTGGRPTADEMQLIASMAQIWSNTP